MLIMGMNRHLLHFAKELFKSILVLWISKGILPWPFPKSVYLLGVQKAGSDPLSFSGTLKYYMNLLHECLENKPLA